MKHNMKKSLSLLLSMLVLLMALATVQPSSVHAAAPEINAKSAILVDSETGKIIYAKNPDMALPPASMTKMMTEYLVQEAIEKGEISWDTTTTVSDYAYKISGNTTSSGIGLTKGKEYTVKELYDAMAVFSDNGTTIALAELIAGSEGDFVKMMREKAKEMGLPEYNFVNSTGLANSYLGENAPEGTDPNGNNKLSAKSAALLAYNLVNDYPKALDVTSQATTEFEGYTKNNLNWMLDHDSVNLEQFYYKGVDGLKTGYTDKAGYCFTGTAQQNNQRYISVVMKTDGKAARFEETANLLDYGFNNFKNQEIFPSGYQLEDKSVIPVSKGKDDTVKAGTAEAFSAPVKGEEADKYSVKYQLNEDKLNKDGKLAAPIEKGEKIGTAEVVYNGNNNYGYIFPNADEQSIDLVAQKSVEKDNWFMLTLGAIGGFFANIFSTVVDTVTGWF